MFRDDFEALIGFVKSRGLVSRHVLNVGEFLNHIPGNACRMPSRII